MATYCRIESGAIVERRNMAPESIPAHKAAMWRLLVDNGWPSVAPTKTVTRAEIIEQDQVRAEYTITTRPEAEIKGMIKEEARRRILDRFPDWKQANMTARGVELLQIKTARAWTVEEQAEADALTAAWTWIKAVRSASDALELTMPDDFAADANWPE